MHILPIYTIDKDTGSIVHPSLLISRQHRSLLGKTIRSQRLFLFERPRLHALLNDSCQFFLLNQSRNNRIPTTSFIIHAATPCNVFFSRKGWHYDILFSPFMSKCGRHAWSMSLHRSPVQYLVHSSIHWPIFVPNVYEYIYYRKLCLYCTISIFVVFFHFSK